MHHLLQQFLKEKIVVIMRGLTPEKAVPCGDALVKTGIHLMEVPLNRPGALEAIHALADHFRSTEIHIGAGTVLKPEQVDAVAMAPRLQNEISEKIFPPKSTCSVTGIAKPMTNMKKIRQNC